MDVIETRGVGKRYRLGADGAEYATLRETLVRGRRRRKDASIWAVKDIDLRVGAGEQVGVIGRNGSGKSTLLKILARITEPTLGLSRTRGTVGALLEVGTGFHPELAGRDNIALNGAVLGMSRREVRARFDDIVAFAGVERFLDTPLKRYSTGMQLRLAFSVAAHLQPSILLVDEVLAVGDAEFQRRCLGKMSELHGDGRTVVFVSHDLGAVSRQCPRCIWLDGGRIVADGPSAEVLDRYTASVSAALPERTFEVPDGTVGLRSVRVLPPAGADADTLRRGEPLAFELVLVVRRVVRGLDVAVAVSDRRGTLILEDALSDHTGGITGRLDQTGVHRLRVAIPPLLPAREHLLRVWLGTELETLFDEEVLAFAVEPRIDDRREWIDRPRLVQPPAHWSVEISGA